MSVAVGQFQMTFIPDVGTVLPKLMWPWGDLEQTYTGSANAPDTGSIDPDLHNIAAASAPFLMISIMETDPDIVQADIASMIVDEDTQWYINDELLHFTNGVSDANGECKGFSGCFRKLPSKSTSVGYRAEAPYGGLAVIDNLVTGSNGQNLNVSVVIALNANGVAVKMKASEVIKIKKRTGTSDMCRIYCDPKNAQNKEQSFVLDEKHETVVCKVKCWQGGQELASSAFTRKWYLIENGGWVYQTDTETFTVDRDMIKTFGSVMCECYVNNKKVSSDTQNIQDASDSLVLSPNPTPADGIFYQTGGPDEVVFKPTVKDEDGTVYPVDGFKFLVVDSAGNPQNTGPSNEVPYLPKSAVDATGYSVSAEIARNINEGPRIIITAIKN